MIATSLTVNIAQSNRMKGQLSSTLSYAERKLKLIVTIAGIVTLVKAKSLTRTMKASFPVPIVIEVAQQGG